MTRITKDEGRFFDGEEGPGSEMRIVLSREYTTADELWKMVHQIGYDDREKGLLRVPADRETFLTDMTSVPHVFTWLVPRTGTHLPAALVHDGLISDGGDPTHLGSPVTSIEADRVFRSAMFDLGTPFLRRWIVWTAVTLRSVKTVRPVGLAAAMYATLAAIAVLGYVATLDLFDQVELLPWMGDRGALQEMIFGTGVAILIPVVLALPWRIAHLYRAGLVAGWAIAVLFHVTAAVATVTGLYLVAEFRLQVFNRRSAKVNAGLLAGILAAVAGLVALTIWLCVR